jgi:hypothetical protein
MQEEEASALSAEEVETPLVHVEVLAQDVAGRELLRRPQMLLESEGDEGGAAVGSYQWEVERYKGVVGR